MDKTTHLYSPCWWLFCTNWTPARLSTLQLKKSLMNCGYFFGGLGVCLFSGFVRLSLLLSFRFAALQGWICPDKRGYAKISKISCYFHPNTEYNVSKLVSYFYLFLKRVRIQSLQYISNKSYHKANTNITISLSESNWHQEYFIFYKTYKVNKIRRTDGQTYVS